MVGKKIIGKYRNGNYNCIICQDGTKLRYNEADNFQPEFPETIDVCISERCEQGCAFCYANCTPDGKIANLNHPIFDSIPPYVELALNGNGIESMPDFDDFLRKMRERKVICNITFHLNQFEQAYSRIKYWHDTDLIYGVGISVNQEPTNYQLTLLRSNSDFVVHVVAGVVSFETITKMYDCGLKLLVLGYKNKGHGHSYNEVHPEIQARIAQFEALLDEMKAHFKLISFDNLAVKQLHMREHVSEEEWHTLFLGDDGQFSMYLNICQETYARSSMDEEYTIFSNDIKDLFTNIRNK